MSRHPSAAPARAGAQPAPSARHITGLATGLAIGIGLVALAAAPLPGRAQEAKPVPQAAVDALNQLSGGPHAGYRANHAKGVLVTGRFVPAATAAALTVAPQFNGSSAVPVLVRFSNGTGVPTLPDADPNASPHGIAIRFQLPGGVNTDIVSISANGFPVSTPEAFVALLQAAGASGPGVAHPTPIERFLGEHPAAAKFLTTPRPAPSSFATLAFYGVNAFKFSNAKGESRYVRYQILPVAGESALSADQAAKAAPNYLMDELPARLATAPVSYRLMAQVAQAGDPVDDASQVWPDDRQRVELGVLTLDKLAPDQVAAQKALLFNPLALVNGIEPSADPVLLVRPAAYAVSYAQRAR